MREQAGWMGGCRYAMRLDRPDRDGPPCWWFAVALTIARFWAFLTRSCHVYFSRVFAFAHSLYCSEPLDDAGAIGLR
jgi:hypothetical protein